MVQYLEKESDFNEIVKSGNVVVDFFATWCGPCCIMTRVLQEVEKDYPNVTFLKVDTDKFAPIAMAFSIVSIPTLIAYKDGKRIPIKHDGAQEGQLLGARGEEDFRLILNETFQL